MANPKKKLFMNFPGPWYVDSTCINCDACRQIAPDTFAEAEDYAYVKAQPQDDDQRKRATQALICCPTGSIGAEESIDAAAAIQSFPQQIQPDIYYTGFNSPSADGGNSYVITHPAGNWLIDSPRYHRHLRSRFSEMGGIDFSFFTDVDYYQDNRRYGDIFGYQRIVHSADLDRVPDTHVVIRGDEPQRFMDDFILIPVPFLSHGNLVMLYKKCILFSGRHIWWNPYYQKLQCTDYPDKILRKHQREFIENLMEFPVEGIFPSHDHRVHRSTEEMKTLLLTLYQTLAN